MIIQCYSCRTRYHYDEGRFSGQPLKKIRCTKCATVFEVKNPAFTQVPEDYEAEETHSHGVVPSESDFALESTAFSGPRRKPGADAVPAPAPPRAGPTDEVPRGAPGPEEGALRLPDTHRLSLACIAGPDSGRIFEIDKPRAVIGRANADVLLTDAQCSRVHAAVEVQGDGAWVVDMGSTNGTWVGERRVNRHPLDNRTEFDVGATTLMFIKTRKD